MYSLFNILTTGPADTVCFRHTWSQSVKKANFAWFPVQRVCIKVGIFIAQCALSTLPVWMDLTSPECPGLSLLRTGYSPSSWRLVNTAFWLVHWLNEHITYALKSTDLTLQTAFRSAVRICKMYLCVVISELHNSYCVFGCNVVYSYEWFSIGCGR